jgi:hypothetical protein
MDKEKNTIRIITISYWVSTVLYSFLKLYGAFFFISSNSQDYLIFLGLPNWFSFELGFGMFLGGLILAFPFFPPRLKEWAYVAFGIVELSGFIANLVLNSFKLLISINMIFSILLLVVSYLTFHKIYQNLRN